jgi:hypothetical protein
VEVLMPADSFDVGTYNVSVGSIGRGDDWSARYILLTSKKLAGGVRRRALLQFEAWQPSYQFGLGRIFRGGNDMLVWPGYADFRDFYDVLRAERPIRFDYAFSDPSLHPYGESELWWIDLNTSLEEPPGEGPAE